MSVRSIWQAGQEDSIGVFVFSWVFLISRKFTPPILSSRRSGANAVIHFLMWLKGVELGFDARSPARRKYRRPHPRVGRAYSWSSAVVSRIDRLVSIDGNREPILELAGSPADWIVNQLVPGSGENPRHVAFMEPVISLGSIAEPKAEVYRTKMASQTKSRAASFISCLKAFLN